MHVSSTRYLIFECPFFYFSFFFFFLEWGGGWGGEVFSLKANFMIIFFFFFFFINIKTNTILTIRLHITLIKVHLLID